MRNATSRLISLAVFATLVVGSVTVLAQNQNQSIWQRIKNSAKQAGQNTAQQGSQQVQQGVQQGAGAVGNQMNGAQPSPCGSLTGGAGGTLTNAAFNGGSTGNSAVGSCGQNCFNAGPFAAAVSQMTMSQQGYWHIIRMEIQFHNATNQPLAIAYHEGSMVMIDDLGNTYQAAGGNPGEVQGMGIDRGNQTDSQFVLGPGQTSSALFSVARARNNTQAIGAAYTYNFTIDELQGQNGAQAIVARQYNLNFPNMTAGSSGGAFPSGAPANGFVGGAGNAAGSVGNYAGGNTGYVNNSTGAAPTGRNATPAQRMMANPGTRSSGVAAATPNSRIAPRAPISNAALRSTSTTTSKPAAAVKPVPAKTAVKKTADNSASNK